MIFIFFGNFRSPKKPACILVSCFLLSRTKSDNFYLSHSGDIQSALFQQKAKRTFSLQSSSGPWPNTMHDYELWIWMTRRSNAATRVLYQVRTNGYRSKWSRNSIHRLNVPLQAHYASDLWWTTQIQQNQLVYESRWCRIGLHSPCAHQTWWKLGLD